MNFKEMYFKYFYNWVIYMGNIIKLLLFEISLIRGVELKISVNYGCLGMIFIFELICRP